MAEVRAAKQIVTKKSMATTELSTGVTSPILEKMKGRVSNMSPGPAPGSIPAAKTAGITAKPAMRAKSRSKKVVPKPETRMFSFLSI